MTKYFTKEYIREADCELIQDYKKELDYCCEVALKISDREYDNKIYRAFSKGKNNKYLLSGSWSDVVSGIYPRSRLVWLPIGDLLDEEIVKICGEDYRNYIFEYSLSDDNEKIYDYKAVIQYYTPDIDPEDGVENYLAFYEHDTNPLIAKIKLLKALLKENKKC